MNAYSNSLSDSPRVTFLGAARTVTGSMHLVECGPYRLLLDCGLHRGPRDEARARNRSFPFEPTSLDAVIVSHAHIDHGGNLPNLVRQGYTGPIYCTPATRDLLSIMLADSARIQEDDAALNGNGHRNGDRRPLYTRQDAFLSVERCSVVDYRRKVAINQDIELEFLDAGHLLGSAMVSLKMHSKGKEYHILFSGDLGRRGLPYMPEPSLVPAADLLICESTYGGVVHDTSEGMAAKMSDIVTRTQSRGGKILIPAFSLGRTQIVLHFIRRWMAEGRMPRMPIYVDSPLAAEISLVYEEYADRLAPEAADIPYEHLLSTEEAWFRTTAPGSSIIIASGGMCEGGRIVSHLKQHVDDPRSTVVLVSYQAPGTLGSQLLERKPNVRFQGRTWNKWIEVAEVNGFSGHADHNDFRDLLGHAASKTGKVRLVHGEVERAEALAKLLREIGFADVEVPTPEASVQCVASV